MKQHLVSSTILIVVVFAFIPLTHSGVPQSRYEAIMKREAISTLGLYNSTDKVNVLNDTNFKSNVVGQNHASLVEFYNSYCGHCKRFAPVYKELAEDCYKWRDFLKVQAIDCAAEENNDICREYEVMAYPTMRYFGPKYEPSEGNYGTPIETQNPDEIKKKVSDLVMNETAPTDNWPNFSNLTEEEAPNVFQELPQQVYYVVLILTTDDDLSNIAAQTILNFNRYPQMQIRRITDEKLGEQFHINQTSRMCALDRNMNMEAIPVQENTPKAYKESVEHFAKMKKLVEKPDAPTPSPEKQNTLIDEEIKEEQQQDKEIIDEVKRNKHMTYQADLEQAIRHILNNEIPRINEISGERLLALQRIMNVLQRYNPLGRSGQTMVNKLQEYVAENNQGIAGKDFENMVHKLEIELPPVYSSSRYVGCTGSKPNLRGFTCSLWKLFHYLTAQAAANEKSSDPLEVLSAIHGVVKYFFGCTDCSEHFQDMAKRRKIWSTPSKDEAVLWLWDAHNEVNARLAGDDTEDPQFPKLQFPTKESCQLCQKNASSSNSQPPVWDRAAVLNFLKNINNPAYVSRFGLDDPNILQASLENLRQKRMVGNVFSDMDMRMGMLLYGFCIVMMIAAFKLFAFKGYRKKAYAHDFLGKV
ncbi:sulfhydryl oxidase 1 [Episyrphus balteatus]|uniref:sulfhydryl oxidase 1 n=1 Tax=Episyrphus balteatus TaxID=286459 RepID=UPI002486B06E|nr:sulfhydryl oxidase 1 [Episyrphus balteatus]